MNNHLPSPEILQIIRREIRAAMSEHNSSMGRRGGFESSVSTYHPKRTENPHAMVMESKEDLVASLRTSFESWITPEEIQKRQSNDSFSQRVLHHIDSKNLKDADVYKAAGLDRRLFSKLRSNKDYQPTKATAMVLCLALQLRPGEAEELLGLAGYSFSRASGRDIVVQICLEHRIYELMAVNNILYEFLFEPF